MRKLQGHRPKFQLKQRGGAAVVETAIALPLLIILTLGVVECCDAIFVRQSLVVAAYEGARVAIVPGAASENVEYKTQTILTQRGVRDATVTVEPVNFPSLPAGSEITVVVEVPASSNSFTGLGFFRNRIISGSVTVFKEY